MINEPTDVRAPCELLPCPYCGRAARYVAEDYVDNSGEPWPFAECDACNTGAPVEFWNKRAQPADQQGEPFGYWCEPHGLPLLGIFNKTVEQNSGSHCNVIPLYRHGQPATAKEDERLTEATAFVQKLCDAASGQPSVATGYLIDILDVLQGRSKLNTPQ
ncbi:hypothetical protein WBQ28_15885 [Pseudomonas syringae pv. syringae]|uniref:hypothetical protein n=1 Tax=Pseudomonas syringae TaxID=317 RepID=UPI003B00B5A7